MCHGCCKYENSWTGECNSADRFPDAACRQAEGVEVDDWEPEWEPDDDYDTGQ